MNELLAPQTYSPDIGDVLASIRRLIAQEDQAPDFASLTRRTDAKGTARSTLPLGPRAERLRSVIERELNGVEIADNRLVLGSDDMAGAETATLIGSILPNAAENAVEDLPGFDEDAYQAALRDGLGIGIAHSASIMPIKHKHIADGQSVPAEQEPDMMLAEVNRATLKDEAALLHPRNDFDLFATDAADEDDQLAGGNALRNLVRDVIRQELQGEMGDRISRNLRRMVRQEVAAAISAGLKTS